MSEKVPAGDIVNDLGIRINIRDGYPTAGLLIIRTLYPTNEVGLTIGTASTQSWIDNIGLVRAADIVIQNDMLMHTFSSFRQD
jgi:hypothetical protein